MDATDHSGSNGQRFTYQCSPDGTADSIWGTNVYTDDSSICTAAVHMGVITLVSGGVVTIEIRGGRSSYKSSLRHGIQSLSWGSWSGSFVVIVP